MSKKSMFAVLAALFLLTAATAPALADKTGPRPGAEDTISAQRRNLFSDIEPVLVQGSWIQNMVLHPLSPADEELKWWGFQTNAPASLAFALSHDDNRPVSAAAGRIMSHEYDSVAFIRFSEGDNVPGVYVLDQDGLDEVASFRRYTLTCPGKRSADIAVADLDGYTTTVKDGNGKDLILYHDEILVVHTLSKDWQNPEDTGYQMYVLEPGPDGSTLEVLALEDGWFDHPIQYVAAVTGDFDGDMKNEFAIALSGDEGDTHILTYRITLDANRNRVLAKMATYTLHTTSHSLDMTAGDFDGDGADELFLVHGKKPIRYYVLKLETDPDNPDDPPSWHPHDHDVLNGDDGARAVDNDLRVVSGLFKLDPEHGMAFNMRQVLVAYAKGDGSAPYIDFMNHIRVSLLDVRDLDKVITLDTHDIKRKHWDAASPIRHIDVAAGNFIGHGIDGKAQSPVDQALISYQWWEMNGPFPDDAGKTHQSFSVVTTGDCVPYSGCEIAVPATIDLEEKDCSDDGDRKKYHFLSAVAAPDRDGDSWVLGHPVHVLVQSHLGVDFLVQEPPKHVDAFFDRQGNLSIENISAYSNFYMELEQSQDTTFNNRTTDTSSWDMGAGVSMDLKSGENFDCVLDKGSYASEIKTKISYDYKTQESSYNGKYTETKLEQLSQTNDDDLIIFRYQDIDIWRYPVYGYDTGDPDNPLGMYEMLFPGPKSVKTSWGKALSSWYQPSHVNGNALSYPPGVEFGGTLPADVGAYTVVTDHGTVKKTTCINDPGQIITYAGNGHSDTISWTDGIESGGSRETDNSFDTSMEYSYGTSGGSMVGPAWSFKVSLSFHANTSFGKNTEHSFTQDATTGISMAQPDITLIDTGQYYDINTAVYFDKSGSFKTIHGTTFGQESSEWFYDRYGARPDPGLSLPDTFKYCYNKVSGDYWEVETGTNRMKMRGVFLTESDPNPVSGVHEYFDIIYDGDKVRLGARVYNFSTSVETGEFTVRFSYLPIKDEDGSHMELAPIEFAEARVSLDPLEQEIVWVEWDTANLAEAYPYVNGRGEQCFGGYRFYVTLDPDNEVPGEIHELDEVPGNNQGYWPWGAGIHVCKVPPPPVPGAPAVRPETSLHDKSLALEVDGRLLDEGSIVLDNACASYRMRVHVQHAGSDDTSRHVFISEDHPEKTNWIIADEIIRGADGQSSYVWATWTPKAPGEYDLHAEVLEDVHDAIPGNALDSLHVTVLGEPGPARLAGSIPAATTGASSGACCKANR